MVFLRICIGFKRSSIYIVKDVRIHPSSYTKLLNRESYIGIFTFNFLRNESDFFFFYRATIKVSSEIVSCLTRYNEISTTPITISSSFYTQTFVPNVLKIPISKSRSEKLQNFHLKKLHIVVILLHSVVKI